MKPVSGSNRASKAFAQTVFEQLYENQNLRVACAQILSDCIFIAHQISPSCWSLTLFSDRVRLNVGPVEVVVLTSEEVFLVISDAENHRFAGKALDSFITPSELHFPSVPVNQRLCYIPSDKIPRLYPLIAKPHKSFVRSAAERRKKTTWSKS